MTRTTGYRFSLTDEKFTDQREAKRKLYFKYTRVRALVPSQSHCPLISAEPVDILSPGSSAAVIYALGNNEEKNMKYNNSGALGLALGASSMFSLGFNVFLS